MGYRIGSAQGYYGDDVTRAIPLIKARQVDVLCFDALSELTLAILQKNRLRQPDSGYTFDINIIGRKILPLAYKQHIPIVTNGGGLNPLAAAKAVLAAAKDNGLQDLKIAVVTGDDVLDRLQDLQRKGEEFSHLETGKKLALANTQIITANVYLGAQPVANALRHGADIVITGRVADPSLYLAPLIAHYRWTADDWARLASGIVAGHLLECPGQVVGGNSLACLEDFTGSEFNDLGLPFADVDENGDFTLGKTQGQGRLTVDTVKEQLLYEIHDPANYVTPDVIVDFTTLQLRSLKQNQVRITGVTGHSRPQSLKMNIGIDEGFVRELLFVFSYPQVWRKAKQLQAMIKEAWKDLDIERCEYSYPGINSLRPGNGIATEPCELIVRVVFTAENKDTLQTAIRRIMALGLNCPAGMGVSSATIGQQPRQIIGLWPTLIARSHIIPKVHFLEC